MIFVDGGSIHNFIQSNVMKYLNLPSSLKLWLQVMVGNITNMECNTTSYSQVPIDIQGHHFTLGLFALPLNGADLVLGVQWLKELGPITMDYNTITMSSSHLGHPVILQVDVPLQATQPCSSCPSHTTWPNPSFFQCPILTSLSNYANHCILQLFIWTCCRISAKILSNS